MAKKTRVEIIKAFEHLLATRKYEKITVRDVTEICSLNRKTFYYYFTGMDDLLIKAFDWEITNYFESVPRGTSINDALVGFFNLINDNKEIIYHVYNSQGCEHLVEYIRTNVFVLIKKDLEDDAKKKGVTEEQTDMICRMLTYIFAGFIITWIDNGMEQDVAQTIKQIDGLIAGMRQLLLENAVIMNEKEAGLQ